MTPADRERLERTRYAILTLARFSGVLLMLAGLWVWHGDILREGGWAGLGVPMFIAGLIESLVVPQILVRQWRTPREP